MQSKSGKAPLPIRVLLIEDNEEQMLLVKALFEDTGAGQYEFEWANRLAQGIDRLRNGRIDVVLLDLGLAGCGGSLSFDLIRSTMPNVPVIVLTAEHREQIVQDVVNHGAAHYLVKDETSGTELLRAIRGAMDRTKTKTPQAQPQLKFHRGAWQLH